MAHASRCGGILNGHRIRASNSSTTYANCSGIAKMSKYSETKFIPQRLRRTPIGKRYVKACLITLVSGR